MMFMSEESSRAKFTNGNVLVLKTGYLGFTFQMNDIYDNEFKSPFLHISCIPRVSVKEILQRWTVRDPPESPRNFRCW